MADNTTNAGDDKAPKPSRSNYQTLDSFISDTGTLLTNALTTDVWEQLKDRGYSQEDIQARAADLGVLRKLNEAQKKEYGEQYQATKDYSVAEDAVHEDYKDHLDYARLALKDNVSAQTALGLTGRRKASQSGYTAQALQFYNNALENADWKKAIMGKGVKETELTDMRDKFKSLDQLAAAQQKETGEAVTATKRRDVAYDTLHDWVQDFRDMAGIALRRKPDMGKQLGL